MSTPRADSVTRRRRSARGTAQRTRRRDAGSGDVASQAVENAEVARILREVADLLELQSANAFRIRAYRNAARAVEELPGPVGAPGRDGGDSLTDVPGIGEDLAGKIEEIARTGSLSLLRQLKRKAPRGAVELMHVRGIGPKRARRGLVRAAP